MAEDAEYERTGHGYTTLSPMDFEKERSYGYCLYEDPNEPSRRCHRPFGHENTDDRGHSEFPMSGDRQEKHQTPADEKPDDPCGCQG